MRAIDLQALQLELDSLVLILLQNKLVADGFVAGSPPGMHLRQHRDFKIHIIVDDYLFLGCVQPV